MSWKVNVEVKLTKPSKLTKKLKKEMFIALYDAMDDLFERRDLAGAFFVDDTNN